MTPKLILLFSVALIVTLISNAKADPSVEWTFSTDGRIDASVNVVDDIVYVGSYDKTFYAVGPTGSLIWSSELLYPHKSKALISNGIICLNNGNRLIGLDQVTGHKLWIHEPEEVKSKEPKVQLFDYDFEDSTPVLKDGIAYYGNEYGSIYGVNIKTGTEQFHFKSESSSPVRAAPLINGNFLITCDYDGSITSIALTDGSIQWQNRTFEGPSLYNSYGGGMGHLVANDTHFFFGKRLGAFQAYDLWSGEAKWSDGEPGGGWISGTPLNEGETIYVGESFGQGFRAYEADSGKLIWRYQAGQGNYHQPASYKEYIILLTGDEGGQGVPIPEVGTGRIHILNKKGQLVKVVGLPGSLFNTPQVVGDNLYFGSRDGNIYKMDLEALLAENQ